MGRSEGKQPTRLRKLWFAALATMLVLLVLEGAAWLIDLGTGFHAKVTRALEQLAPLDGPVPAQESLKWPPGVLHVRSAFGEKPRSEPYMLGGKPVPGVHMVPTTEEYTSAEARSDPRPKVFVVGGSAAFGFPHSYPESAPALLQERIGYRGELVVNASRVGWASGHLVPLVGRVADEFSPDVVIILLGNNEFARFTPKNESGISPAVMGIYRQLSFSRLASLGLYWRLKSWEERQGEGKSPQEIMFASHGELTGYEYAVKHPAVDFDGQAWRELRAAFLDNFERNLRLMVAKV